MLNVNRPKHIVCAMTRTFSIRTIHTILYEILFSDIKICICKNFSTSIVGERKLTDFSYSSGMRSQDVYRIENWIRLWVCGRIQWSYCWWWWWWRRWMTTTAEAANNQARTFPSIYSQRPRTKNIQICMLTLVRFAPYKFNGRRISCISNWVCVYCSFVRSFVSLRCFYITAQHKSYVYEMLCNVYLVPVPPSSLYVCIGFEWESPIYRGVFISLYLWAKFFIELTLSLPKNRTQYHTVELNTDVCANRFSVFSWY